MMKLKETVRIDDNAMASALERQRHADAARVREVLAKAHLLNGLAARDTAALMHISDPDLLHELFDTAQAVTTAIYGRRLVIFAPSTCRTCARTSASTARFAPGIRNSSGAR